MTDAAVGTLIGGTLVGVLVLQVPIGWLADRIGRERVLVGCFVVVAAGLAGAPYADAAVGLPALLFVVGVCSGAFYPLGLALLGEKLPAAAIPRANAWFLGVNCLGSLVSPALSGGVMVRFGASALFWAAEIVVAGILLLWLGGKLSKQAALARQHHIRRRDLDAPRRAA
jgi:MFS family permease